MNKIKIGILRETKNPPDKRVALTPQQCSLLLEDYKNVELYIQPSNDRSFTDEEYKGFGLTLKEDLSDCDILLGIKEVSLDKLIPEKKYMFFSHTIKKQPRNQELLKQLLKKKITLIDYETLTDKDHNRIIGFGRYAGIVGAYNGLRGYGKKYEQFDLKPAYKCRDREELSEEMKRIKLSNIKIAVTGSGRVTNGALEVLGELKIRKVTPYEYVHYSYREPVYTQLQSGDYHTSKLGKIWSSLEFYANPHEYDSTFEQYYKVTDLLMHCSFWDPKAPRLFSKMDMRKPAFRISVIADLSCDIDGGVPSTIRASDIEHPFYGYNPSNETEDVPFSKNSITVMAVDNLPCELPRSASEDFGKSLMERVFPSLLMEDSEGIIDRATITRLGELTHHYNYLSDYAGLE